MNLNIIKPVDPSKTAAVTEDKKSDKDLVTSAAPWLWHMDSDSDGDFYWKAYGWRIYSAGRTRHNCLHSRSGIELVGIRGLEMAKKVCQFINPTIPRSYR